MALSLFVAIAVAAGWNYQQNTNEVELSNLALENVEALADPEIEVGVPCIMTSQTCYEIKVVLGHTVNSSTNNSLLTLTEFSELLAA